MPKRTSHDTYKSRRSDGNDGNDKDKRTIKSKLITILKVLEVNGGEDISKEEIKDLIELLVSHSSELMIRGGEVLQRTLIHYCATYGEHEDQIEYDGDMKLGRKADLDIGALLINRSVTSILATEPRDIDEVRRLCQVVNILGKNVSSVFTIAFINDPSPSNLLYIISPTTLESHQVMAIDPGIVQAAATHVKEVDGTTTSTTITSRMIRSMSGSIRRVEKANKRNRNNPTILSLRALPSRKTVDNDILNLRHERLYSTQAGAVSLYDLRKVEYELVRRRNLQFTAYRRKQSVYASIVHSLSTSKLPLLILFEDASFSSTMRGNAPVAVSLFKKLCKLQHIVIDIPRYMTSQTCPRCLSRFGKTIKIVDGKARSVRGLLCCQSKQCKSACYFDRDMTSAEVIYFVGTTPEEDLPDILREDKKDDRPQRPPRHVLRV